MLHFVTIRESDFGSLRLGDEADREFTKSVIDITSIDVRSRPLIDNLVNRD
jgi:hypothetical protein